MRLVRPLSLLALAAVLAACSSRPATPDQPARVEAAPPPNPQPRQPVAAGSDTPVRRPQPAPTPTQTQAQARPAQPAQPVPAAAEPRPAPQPAPKPTADAEAWRPAWWIEGVQKRDGSTVAGAMATEADLLTARRRAVDLAIAALEKALGKAPADTDTKVDTLRLPDGRYRAFILVSAPAN